jgi:hypothetical protein
MRRIKTALIITVISIVLLTACRSTEHAQSQLPEPATAAQLDQRPLYTFNEGEVDAYLKGLANKIPSVTERVIHLGRKNIGQPYEIYLLGEYPFETYDPDPLYCLSKSDCLVFTEHMYAMALSNNWWEFLQTLQRLRYNAGQIGMVTRNHYTVADWDRNNGFLFEDITTKLGAGQVHVDLNQTLNRSRFLKQFNLGQDIPDEPVHDTYIPKQRVGEITGELRSGDFVNIIRGSTESQWCGHTGLIAIGDDGTANFLHSARPTVREQSLVGYIMGDKRCVGIKILRLREDAEAIMAKSRDDGDRVTPESLRKVIKQSPLARLGMPDWYFADPLHVQRVQTYRLPHDAPTEAVLQNEIARLDNAIRAKLGINADQRAFGVLDLNSLRHAWLNPDQMFYGASVPKICILLGYFAQHPEAATDLDPAVRSELEQMIKRSSNELAAKYSQLVGLDFIQETLQSKRYKLYDGEHGGGFWCGKHYGHPTPRTGDPVHDHSNAVTVRQCLRYYLMLEQGRLVNAEACATMKEIFHAPSLEHHGHNFVGGLADRDALILRKSGLWEDWHLDTARILHGDQLYIMAGMTHHPMGQEYLAKMAASVDDFLAGRHSSPLLVSSR